MYNIIEYVLNIKEALSNIQKIDFSWMWKASNISNSSYVWNELV